VEVETIEEEPNYGGVKVQLPDNFNGDRAKLRAFLAQTGLYLTFNEDRF